MMVDEDPKEKARAAANGGSKRLQRSGSWMRGITGGFGRAVGGGTRGSALVTAESRR